RADALLGIRRPLVFAGAGAEEHVLELVHPRVGEQQRWIVERHHRRRAHERVPVLLDEEVDELLADFVRGWHGFLNGSKSTGFAPLSPLGRGAGGEGPFLTFPSPLTPLPSGERGTLPG